MTDFHSIEMTSITGQSENLSQYDDRVCLVVNVATK